MKQEEEIRSRLQSRRKNRDVEVTDIGGSRPTTAAPAPASDTISQTSRRLQRYLILVLPPLTKRLVLLPLVRRLVTQKKEEKEEAERRNSRNVRNRRTCRPRCKKRSQKRKRRSRKCRTYWKHSRSTTISRKLADRERIHPTPT